MEGSIYTSWRRGHIALLIGVALCLASGCADSNSSTGDGGESDNTEYGGYEGGDAAADAIGSEDATESPGEGGEDAAPSKDSEQPDAGPGEDTVGPDIEEPPVGDDGLFAPLACPDCQEPEEGACVESEACRTACRTTLEPIWSAAPFGRSAGRRLEVSPQSGVVWMASAAGLEAWSVDERGALVALGWVSLPNARDVVLHPTQPLAAVAVAHAGVALVDTSTPEWPTVVGTWPAVHATSLAWSNYGLHVGTKEQGHLLLDVSEPASPALQWWWADAVDVVQLDALDGHLVVLTDTSLIAFDLSAARAGSAPEVRSVLPIAGTPLSVRMDPSTGYAFVAAGFEGLHLVDPAGDDLTLIASWKAPSGMVHDAVGAGDTVWAAGGVLYGAHAVDISNPEAPELLGLVPTAGSSEALALGSTYVWSADSYGGLKAYDGSTPESPTLALVSDAPQEARNVDIQGDWAAVARGASGVLLYTGIEAGQPEWHSTIATEHIAMAAVLDLDRGLVFAVERDYGVAGQIDGRVEVFGLDGEAVGSVEFKGWPSRAELRGTNLWVISTYGGIRVFDTASPNQPLAVAALDSNGTYGNIVFDGSWGYAARIVEGVQTWDLTDPTSPTKVATWTLGDYSGMSDIVSIGGVLVVAHVDGLHILSSDDPTALSAVAFLELPQPAQHLSVVSETALIAGFGDGTFAVVDLATPTQPRYSGTFRTHGGTRAAVVEGVAWFADAAVPLHSRAVDCIAPLDASWPAPLPTISGAGAPEFHHVHALAPVPEVSFEPWGQSLPFTHGWGATELVVGEPIAIDTGRTGFDTEPLPAGALGKAIATGSAQAPAVVMVPDIDGDAPDHRLRLRFVHAAPTAGGVELTLWQGGRAGALGRAEYGYRGPWREVLPQTGVLEVQTDGLSAVWTVPPLLPGSSADLILAEDATGRLFIIVQLDDGSTLQLGSLDNRAQLRVVNLWEAEVGLGVTIDGHEHPSGELSAMNGLAHIDVWPGVRELEYDGPGAALTAQLVSLQAGDSKTAVVFGPPGAPTHLVTDDVSVFQTGGDTVLRLFHLVSDWGPVNVMFTPAGGVGAPWQTLWTGAAYGELNEEKVWSAGSYRVGVDIDNDGYPELEYEPGYFPDYGFHLYLVRRADGTVVLGRHSSADGSVWFSAPTNTIAPLRVARYDTAPGAATIEVDNPYADAPWLWSVQARSSKSELKIPTGETHVQVYTADWSDESWGPFVFGEENLLYTVDGLDGVPTLHLAPSAGELNASAPNVRFIHGAPSLGNIESWFQGPGAGTLVAYELPFGKATSVWSGPVKAVGESFMNVDVDGNGGMDVQFKLPALLNGELVHMTLVEGETTLELLIDRGFGDMETLYPVNGIGLLRFVAAVPNSEDITVTRNGKTDELWGNLTVSGLNSWGVAVLPAEPLPAGWQTIAFNYGEQSVDLEVFVVEGETTMVLASWVDGQLQAYALDLPPWDAERPARVLHTDASLGEVNVGSPGLDAPIATNLAPGELSDWVDLPETFTAFGLDWNADETTDWWAFTPAPQTGVVAVIIGDGTTSRMVSFTHETYQTYGIPAPE